jgi:hypothetical protein
LGCPRFVLAILVSLFRSKSRLAAENAALRHQLIVLRHSVRGSLARRRSDGTAEPAGHGLGRRFHLIHFPSNQTSARSIGRRRRGMSCASSRAPSGTIQNPNTGRKPKTPKMIRSNPTGTRTQRDDDPLSQRRNPPAPLGSSLDIRSIRRSSRSASRSRIAASSEHMVRFMND